MRKIILYLVLNFLVSAAAVALVLLIWENTHRMPELPVQPSTSEQLTGSDVDVILPPLNQKTMVVQVVIGAGDLNNERVQLVCEAEVPVNLKGWVMSDGQDSRYVFPDVTVFPGGGINIYSRAGVNTAVELFWGRAETAWAGKEKVLLLDPDGNIRAEFDIP